MSGAMIRSFLSKLTTFSGRSALLAFFLINGCASAPKSTRDSLPVEVPQAWSEYSAIQSQAGAEPKEAPDDWKSWLKDFDSPILIELVQEALEYNYDLKATAARLDAARYEVVSAGVDRLPHISGSLGGQRVARNFVGFPSGLSSGISDGGEVTRTTNNSFSLGLDLSWEFDLWGRLRDRKSAAIADLQAARADFVGARLSLAAQTVQSWFSVLEAQLQLHLLEKTALSFQDNADLIQERFDRGLSPALDVRLARANATSAQSGVAQQKLILDERLRYLAVLLGRYPRLDGWGVRLSEDLPELQTLAPVGTPVDLLIRRPDLVAAERRLAAAGVRVKEARKALLPNIGLSASGGTNSEAIEDLLNSDFSVWTLAGQVLQPLFQGRRLVAALERSKAVRREALAYYAAAGLNAFQEVETALSAERFLAEEEMYMLQTAEESVAAEALARDRYRKGLTDIITVLDSQRRALDARSDYLNVRLRRLTNRVTLYLALGGGFE